VRREKLRAFRDKVARSKLVKFYVSPEDLKAQAMHALVTAFLQKPQTGWIRATNARRAEDLEEINKLQTRLLASQEEIAGLRARLHDPRECLSRGDEQVTWTIGLAQPLPSSPAIPAENRISFTDSWDNLFTSCFADRKGFEFDERIWELLELHIGRALVSQGLAQGTAWVEHAKKRSFRSCFSREDLREIVASIRMQFLGLRYITVEGSKWILSEEGSLHAATLLGKLRTP